MFKNKKIILIVIVIIVALGVIVYQFFLKKEKPKFTLEKVVKGTVLKEVSETGTVKISEETNLSFKNSGRLEKIYVKIGDEISISQSLAKLDTSQLIIELAEAQAALEVVNAKKIDAQVSLENARQYLRDVEAGATQDLKQDYQDGLNTLDEAYLKIYNAFNVANSIQRSYFLNNDQEGIKVREQKDKIENALDQAEAYINSAKSNLEYEKIDSALSGVGKSLQDTRDALVIIRDMAETINYRDTVSSTDKTSLDNQKTYINTALTDIIGSQQTILATKVTNNKNINSAKAEILLLENQLKEGGLYQAQINQAQASISLLENKIQESVLRSPIAGQVTKINKREGEMVQPTDTVISFLPTGPFQIEVDIYEEDVVDIKIGNLVKIILAALPDKVLEGRVVSIDPAEKLIGGVVYYKVTIDFETQKEGLKPGMTADVVIESNKKENVLVVPKNALKKIDGKKIVKVFENGQIKEREIEVGLVGDEYIEVTSGLSEGEEIVIE